MKVGWMWVDITSHTLPFQFTVETSAIASEAGQRCGEAGRGEANEGNPARAVTEDGHTIQYEHRITIF